MHLSTNLVQSDLRTEYWREITRPFFETTQHPEDSNSTLEGSLTSRAIGSLLIGPTSFNQQQYRRDRRIVLQGGLDQYLVQLFITGTLEGDCDGQSISVGPGDICAFDLARNFESRVHQGATISIMLPRARVDKAAGGRSLHGVVLKTGAPVTRLLADFIVSLSDVSAEMERADALAMEEAAIDLLASGLARHVPYGATGDPALAQVLRRRVLDFIDANLTEPELGPALLMRRFRVSRAHLYRVFAVDGGVAKVVKERRLDAACRELMHIGGSARSIIEIAHGLGFSSSSQFLRAFRARFDMTPSDVRQQRGEPTDQRLAHMQAHFAEYAQQLGLANRLE
ncbi:helix-turn-helix domain-containing protein [Mesorhizobium shangrilense]|uniref:Helix-turn-helix domain-containing protein n=1 Tax=Mesorhizobium shangrilense TaxID=460060 RepID=A0ABV2DRM3_9HYPH